MLTEDNKYFLNKAKKQAGSKIELSNILRAYVEEEEGDCLLCKQLLLRELLSEINPCN